ncbi:hypothetical protein TEA_027666 [Camellia sinensis var. sinensis]|uniref:Methyltransferase n=1 Tax=Camellia sinensis var. sinensis TaxID=542762 RepID=A0A4S4EQP7_CAMSN|nr:hypothetical protein TEA_027666 [Camellia sinensis var. sinensis]
MAIARFGRQAKRSYGFCVKMTAVAVVGLCFILIWSLFSSSSSVVSQRSTFADVAEPVSSNGKFVDSEIHSKEPRKDQVGKKHKKAKLGSDLKENDEKRINGSASNVTVDAHKGEGKAGTEKKEGDNNHGSVGSETKKLQEEKREQEGELEVVGGEGKENEDLDGDTELIPTDYMVEDGSKSTGKKKKIGSKVLSDGNALRDDMML